MNIAFIFAVVSFGWFVESSDVKNQNQMEEFVLIMRGVEPERYNCSGNTTEEWYASGKKNLILTFYYITSGLIFLTVSVPVLYIMHQPDLIQYPCYKIMFFIGCIESTELWGASIWPGWSTAVGSVYCTHPIATTLGGKSTMMQWMSGTSACVLLGINRFFDLNNGKIGIFNLFDKPYKIRFYLLCCTIYGIYGSMCFDTVLYNSLYMAPLFNPLIGDTRFTYSHQLLFLHNLSVCVCLTVVYFGIAVTWLYKKKESSSQRLAQKHIIAQCIMVSMIYSVPAFLFVLTLCIPQPPLWLIFVSDITYQLSGGVPFILYMVMNQQIRQRTLKFFGKCLYDASVEPQTTTSIWKRNSNSTVF